MSSIKISQEDMSVSYLGSLAETDQQASRTGSDTEGGGEKSEAEFEGSGDESSGVNDQKGLLSTSEIEDGVVREYEVALKYLGFGFFHILLLVINGVALSSDSIEVLSISFIFPVLSRKAEWGIRSSEEAILGSIIFLGMLVGSYVWGSLADVIGRRTTLVFSLLISAIFGFFSAFIPWFWIFVLFRFLSGFG